MKIKNWSSRLIYGSISGLVYALAIAILDYFNDKEFDLRKFIIGFFIFGIAMLIAVRINKSKQ